MAAATKMVIYYDFIPSSEVERNLKGRPYQITRSLVEIRDDNPRSTPSVDPNNPWRIRKKLETHEAATGKIYINHKDVVDYIFNYRCPEIIPFANKVLSGQRIEATVFDMSDDDSTVMYGPEDGQTYFEEATWEKYVLGLNVAMVRTIGLKKDDEIWVYFSLNKNNNPTKPSDDPWVAKFYIKAFRHD